MVRQVNFEVLRILAMYMVLVLHTPSLGESSDSLMWVFMKQLSIVAVNSFVFISGYFMIKTTWKKVLKFLWIPFFYSVLLSIVGGGISLRSFVPWHAWWFVYSYFQLMLVTPIINLFIENGSRKRHLYIIAVACFFNFYMGFLTQQDGYLSGFCLPNFICIYVIANYFRRCKINIVCPGAIFLGLVCVNTIIKFFYCRHIDYAFLGIVDYYNSPTIFAASLCFGLWVANKNMEGISNAIKKVIVFLSSSAFSVYLISNHPLSRDKFYPLLWEYACYKIADNNAVYYMLLAILVNLFIFTLCITMDKLRISIENLLFLWKNKR